MWTALRALGSRVSLHAMIGGKEAKLEKERGEAIAAKLKLEAARAELAEVRQRIAKLRQLIEELGDVNAADWFIDGLAADIFVQSKISASLESVEKTQMQVQGVLEELKPSQKMIQDELVGLKATMREMLEAQSPTFLLSTAG